MRRKFLKKDHRLIEVITPSGQRQTMSLDEYRDKLVAESREKSMNVRGGLRTQQEPQHIVAHRVR